MQKMGLPQIVKARSDDPLAIFNFTKTVPDKYFSGECNYTYKEAL